MQKMKYRVRFLTPAFLGNAEQSGQWRTPPFKAQLEPSGDCLSNPRSRISRPSAKAVRLQVVMCIPPDAQPLLHPAPDRRV